MINIRKLRGKIVERGFNIRSLAKSMGIDQSTLYRRLKNSGKTITIQDAEAISKTLELTPEESRDIFFNQ